MKSCRLFVVAALCLVSAAGCNKPQPQPQVITIGPPPQVIDSKNPYSLVQFKVVDFTGSAALQFDHWLAVFEEVPAKAVPVGIGTAGGLPIIRGPVRCVLYKNANCSGMAQETADDGTFPAGDSGGVTITITPKPRTLGPDVLTIWLTNDAVEKAQIGDLPVSAWDKDSITVSGCKLRFADGGKKLVCPDHTYEAAEPPKAVIISKKGTSREQAYKQADIKSDPPPPPPTTANPNLGNIGEMGFHGMTISVIGGEDKSGTIRLGFVKPGPADDAIITIAGKEIVVQKEQILVGGVTKAKIPAGTKTIRAFLRDGEVVIELDGKEVFKLGT